MRRHSGDLFNGALALGLRENAAELPDLILMDVVMPGMNGYEVMQKIRAVPKWKNLPMIAVT